MAYRLTAMLMTVSDLEGHSLIVCLKFRRLSDYPTYHYNGALLYKHTNKNPSPSQTAVVIEEIHTVISHFPNLFESEH